MGRMFMNSCTFGFGNGRGMMGFSFFWPLVILFLVLYLIRENRKRNEIKEVKNKDNSEEKNVAAIEVLDLRYAKGEITKEEYDRIKSDILTK